MPILGNGEPTQEELMEMQAEQQRRQKEENTANELAAGAAREQGAAEDGYWGVLTDADISSDIEEYDEHLKEFLSAELSGQLTIGNITREDWKSWCWRTENEFWVIKNEFKDPDCKLDSLDMAAMGYEDRPKLTDKRARRLRDTQQVRKMMLSNSVDARGQRSGTEIHAVAKTESQEDEGDDGGGGRISNWLSG